MSPVGLGILLGICNVFANALAFAAVGSEPHAAGMVLVYGMLPGVAAGAFIGAIARSTTSSAPRRFVTLFVPALLVVVPLGLMFELASFVPVSLGITACFTFLLERGTREAALAEQAAKTAGAPSAKTPGEHRSAMKLAMFLGASVMFVVMAGVLARLDDIDQLAGAYIPFGFGAGIGLAAPFGWLVDQMQRNPVWERRFVLLTCALVLTGFLAAFVRLEDLALISFIPTAAGCMILERYSRPPPELAPATAHLTVRA